MGFEKLRISVIIPTRNEQATISRCLDSVLDNSYPSDKTEIIIVDGMSSDGTKGVVEEYMARYSMIKLLDNPKRVTPVAMNIGINNSHGEVIIFVCAHGHVAQDFISKCIRCLHEHTDADCVGGMLKSVSDTFIGKVIALAANSPFGAGGARYRTRKDEGYTTDIVPHPAYRREVFQKIGLIDEDLLRDQDEEFEYRLVRRDGKIYYTPEIKSYAYARSSFKKFGRQYFQYGYWKVRVLQKHRLPASWRHLVPGAFVMGLVGSGVSAIFNLWGLYLVNVILLLYLGASLVFATAIAARHGWRYFLPLPLAFGTMHISYGLGFLKGLWDFVLRKQHLKQHFDDEVLTR